MFRDGEYDPYSIEGLQLIAHELVHVRHYQQAGTAFQIDYLRENAKHGYWANPYERRARATEEAIRTNLEERYDPTNCTVCPYQ